jgi:hypothetical protein
MQQAGATTSWRNRGLTRLALLGGLVLGIVGLGGAPAHAALLDANCPGPPDDGTTNQANSRFAQTFTALHTGTVVRAQVALNKQATNGAFTVQILDTDPSGVPVNGVLGSGTVPGSSIPAGDTTLDATFSSPAPVTAGHLYALVVTRPESWSITDRHGNPCGGEEFYTEGPAFQPNMTPSPYDFVYSVYVNPTNTFTVGKQKGNKLTLTVPGPGSLTVAKKKLLKTTTTPVSGAGAVTVNLKLAKKAKQRLRQKGKLSLNAGITFTPSGGDPATQSKKLKFKNKK